MVEGAIIINNGAIISIHGAIISYVGAINIFLGAITLFISVINVFPLTNFHFSYWNWTARRLSNWNPYDSIKSPV